MVWVMNCQYNIALSDAWVYCLKVWGCSSNGIVNENWFFFLHKLFNDVMNAITTIVYDVVVSLVDGHSSNVKVL